METIFDIFGSRDSVKPSPNLATQSFTAVKGISPNEAVLPGKQIINNGGANLKGKKVLGDVGNQIKGLNKKSESTSQEIKKNLPGSSLISKISPNVNSQQNENLQEIAKENTNPLSQVSVDHSFLFKDCDKLPEVETQGPSFWADDYASIWSTEEKPSIEDFCKAANIWDMEIKPTVKRSPSPVSEDFNDNFDFCLNFPTFHSTEIVLEEETVPFPWEM